MKLCSKFTEKWCNYRPNIRPKYSVTLAEYSVSADTNFDPIGRSLFHEIFFKREKMTHFSTLWLCILNWKKCTNQAHRFQDFDLELLFLWLIWWFQNQAVHLAMGKFVISLSKMTQNCWSIDKKTIENVDLWNLLLVKDS